MTSFTLNPSHEASRLDALHKLDLLDTGPSEAFDRITRLAAQLFGQPMAAVSLSDVNRQWFKSRVGIPYAAVPRRGGPCTAVVESGAVVVIPDLGADPVFRDSALAAAGVRAYAGAPLTTADGFRLGALCVLGWEPRPYTEAECAALQDLAAMVMAQIELQHAFGRIEPRTGLPNRNQFVEDLRDIANEQRPGTERMAAVVNLATPAQVNDALRAMGSHYFDEIVRETVRMLRATVGAHCKVYQVSMVQFVFLAPPATALEAFCADLAAWLLQRSTSVTSRFVTSATIGVAPFAPGAIEPHDLLRNLHSAALDAVDSECGVSVFSAERDAIDRRRFRLINDFGAALEQPGQLRLVYQPKVDLASGACNAAEALLRWTHPELGDISPGEFIPLVERTTLARATTAWVLETAMRQLAAWRAAGSALQLAVNVTAANLLEPDFCDAVQERLARHGLPPASLALEITESALMANPRLARATLGALAEAGIALAIDDFGTGYSSLAYLQNLPVGVVKIDQSFMRGIEHDERKRALVTAMIKLTHDLGHEVVAEGVETAAAASFLTQVACDEAQGYLYARPMAPQAFEQWLGTLGAQPARP
jgi:EAL domain-containing protein (putative c-di-GMP-specific phosphodiesterase class I)/GGDEF domain-containing protein